MSLRSIETSLGTIERNAEGLIYVRLKPSTKLTVAGFAEALAARKELAGGKPSGVVVLVPDDIDFDIQVMNVDHYNDKGAEAFTAAFAIVTTTNLFRRLYDLYATYFRPNFPVKTFDDEASALVWVREKVAALNTN